MLRNTTGHISKSNSAIVTASSSLDCATASLEALMRWILPSLLAICRQPVQGSYQ